MSSGAKRLVQSLRGRSGGRGTGGGRSDAGAGEEGVGGGGASTSATRLCHYDSGHELDEISVIGATIGRAGEGLTTPTTPCHCRSIKYGSGQTLCSIAGLVPPTPAIHSHRTQSGEYPLRTCGDPRIPPGCLNRARGEVEVGISCSALHGSLSQSARAVPAKREERMNIVHPWANIEHIRKQIDWRDSNGVLNQSEEHQAIMRAPVFFLLEYAGDRPPHTQASALLELILSLVMSQNTIYDLHQTLLQALERLVATKSVIGKGAIKARYRRCNFCSPCAPCDSHVTGEVAF